MILNTHLYSALQLAFNTSIKVAKPEMPMRCAYHADAIRGRAVREIKEWGETYVLNCPFCGDKRGRMWVSHQLGQYDPRLRRHEWQLWKCFNEDCQQVRENREIMQARLEGLCSTPILAQPRIPRPFSTETVPPPVLPPAIPDVFEPVSQMPIGHASRRFLERRGLDPQKAYDTYDLYYVVNDFRDQACDRIVAPLIDGYTYHGWLGRYVDDEDSVPPIGVPKWWTAAGTRKSHALFGIDQARLWPFVVIVEGALDVLALGSPEGNCLPGPAVATIGTDISMQQLDLVRANWPQRPVFVMYDGDAWKKTLKETEKLRSEGLNAVPVQLPQDKDPGDLPHQENWRLIRETASRAGISIPVP